MAVIVVKGTKWCWLTLTGEKRFRPRVVLHQRLHRGSKSQTGCDPAPHITVIEIAWLDPHWWLLNFSEWRWFLREKPASVWHDMTLNKVETFVEVISQWTFVHLVLMPPVQNAFCVHSCNTLLRLLSLEIGWGGLRSQIPVSVPHPTTRSRPTCRVGSQTFLLCSSPSPFNGMDYQLTRCKESFQREQCRRFNKNSCLLSIHI